MAELTISPEEIRDALDKFVSNFNPDVATRDEVGTVVTSGDGIARVEGLPSAMANELLEFSNGTLGIALYLLSPIDVIPEVIPFIGVLDDIVLVPLAIRFLLNRLPAHLRNDIGAGPRVA